MVINLQLIQVVLISVDHFDTLVKWSCFTYIFYFILGEKVSLISIFVFFAVFFAVTWTRPAGG